LFQGRTTASADIPLRAEISDRRNWFLAALAVDEVPLGSLECVGVVTPTVITDPPDVSSVAPAVEIADVPITFDLETPAIVKLNVVVQHVSALPKGAA
jgi:hypothetical protein